MKEVVWQDKDGYKQKSIIRDDDRISDAPLGIPVHFIDLRDLDWETLIRDLHNLILERGLSDWEDIQYNPGALSNAIVKVIRPPLIKLYKEKIGDEH